MQKSLLAAPVLCVVIAGCGWCAWAFVEKDEVDEESVEKAGVNGIAVISVPMMGLKEVLVR